MTLVIPHSTLLWRLAAPRVKGSQHQVMSYNAFQSLIRGGHIFLTVRESSRKVHNHGDKLDLLEFLDQDTMDRHLRIMGPDSRVILNSEKIAANTLKTCLESSFNHAEVVSMKATCIWSRVTRL